MCNHNAECEKWKLHTVQVTFHKREDVFPKSCSWKLLSLFESGIGVFRKAVSIPEIHTKQVSSSVDHVHLFDLVWHMQPQCALVWHIQPQWWIRVVEKYRSPSITMGVASRNYAVEKPLSLWNLLWGVQKSFTIPEIHPNAVSPSAFDHMYLWRELNYSSE